eukprot:13396074-Alexandrium_andersonii.AAC.1
MAVDQISVHRLREDVCRVLVAGPFQQGEISGAHTLLRPQLPHCEVPDPPSAGATADANSCAAIGADLKGVRKPE